MFERIGEISYPAGAANADDMFEAASRGVRRMSRATSSSIW
jgi:hypothetical protein